MTSTPTRTSGWPFLATEAGTLGVTDWQLRCGPYRRVFTGTYVHVDVPDTIVVRARAALVLAPEGAVISHHTAARLWGGRVPDNEWTHVSFMRDVRFRVRGIRPHRYRHRLDTAKRHGLVVTTPMHTFCDMARFLGLVDLVALGDSLVRKGRFAPQALVAYADGWGGQFQTEVSEAARLVRDRVDSSPETALRLLLVLAGFPEPDIDIRILDADGTIRFRIDFGYEEFRLAIEYDGRWHESPEQQTADLIRRAELATDGWRFVVVTGDELFDDTEQLLARVVRAAREAGVPVPSRPSSAWRQHFRVIQVAV